MVERLAATVAAVEAQVEGGAGRARPARVTAAYDAGMATAPSDQLIALALRLIEAGEASGLPLRAMGGAGVGLRAPDADPALRRDYGDVDLAAPKRARREVEDLMTAEGLEPEREFNALHGGGRQIWWMPDGSTHVDVFLGEFRMCHRLDLDPALARPGPALPAADLLLTKLQVVELNRKDVQDAAALLSTHPVADGGLSLDRLRDVLAADWGFYTTASDNLERLPEEAAALAPAVAPAVAAACGAIREELERAPKGTAFRMRARVGRRKRWYELPEETVG